MTFNEFLEDKLTTHLVSEKILKILFLFLITQVGWWDVDEPRRTRNSECRASVSTDNLTFLCLIQRNLMSTLHFTPSDVQNLKFLQFAISQKWSVRKIHFLDPYFLFSERPTWKRRKFQTPLSFNFHLTKSSYFKEGWRFDLILLRIFSCQYSLQKKKKFSVKEFVSKCEIFNGQLHFCAYTL